MQAGNGLARKSFGSALMNLNLRVLQQQPQQFSAAIAGCADNAYFHLRPTSST
jgi:hypothetical protein